MTTYIYIPIMTPEMASIANTWNQERMAANKAPYQIISVDDKGFSKALRRKFGGGELSGVADTDRIYLLSHGLATPTSGGALAVGNDRGGKLVNGFIGGLHVQGGHTKLYRVDELARALDKEGLSKTFVDLRLFCCGAGLPATHQGNPVQPLAQRLKNAMTARGYTQIMVTGFKGNLIAGYSEYYAPGTMFVTKGTASGVGLGIKVDGETYAQRAKDHMVQF